LIAVRLLTGLLKAHSEKADLLLLGKNCNQTQMGYLSSILILINLIKMHKKACKSQVYVNGLFHKVYYETTRIQIKKQTLPASRSAPF
jgi:hypothetical protein